MSELRPVPKPKKRPKKLRTPIRRSRVRQKAGKPKRFAKRRDPEYLAWIASQPCLLAGRRHPGSSALHECLGTPVQAAHLSSRGAGGADRGNLVPLDALAHSTQHLMGIKSWATYWFGKNGTGSDGIAELKKLAQQYTERYDRERSVG